MLANPAAKFDPQRRLSVRPSLAITGNLTAKPFERRSICVHPASLADLIKQRDVTTKCAGGKHTHFSRSRVVDAVARGEMRWLDRFHNAAAFTQSAGGIWQKTRSGSVSTMQFKSGRNGRYVPAAQREQASAN